MVTLLKKNRKAYLRSPSSLISVAYLSKSFTLRYLRSFCLLPSKLGAAKAVLFDDLPIVIGYGNLEYTLGQINGNGSSMHFGLLSSKTDPHPHEHRLRLLGAEKTGESIPSVNLTTESGALSERAASRGCRLPSLHGLPRISTDIQTPIRW